MDDDLLNIVENESIELFKSGYICAEAVSKAVLSNLNFDADNLCGVATGFGGGIARQGQTCGALIGGVISIGAVINNGFRKPDQREIKEKVYNKVEKLYKNFEAEFGSSLCRNLTDCDFRTDEGLKKFANENIDTKICTPIVGWSAKETFKLLSD